jgi:hypothetical protein
LTAFQIREDLQPLILALIQVDVSSAL